MEIKQMPEAELEELVTPFFRNGVIENVPQSEKHQRPIMEMRELVQLRFAGDKNYSPEFPADAMYRKVGHRVITYAERFADQYRAFKSGEDQEAGGTPLEMLAEYGITPNQISLCRIAKVYSVEALNSLEGHNLKTLGIPANALKDMARRYMAERATKTSAVDEVAALRAEIERLKAGLALSPLPSPAQEEAAIETARQVADDEYAALSDSELKDEIAKFNEGQRPRGNPNRATLVQSLNELKGAA